MKYWVYIIQSDSSGRYYCGYSRDVTRRLKQHNDPDYTLSRTTKMWKGPWRLAWNEQCRNRSEAVMLERKIKKRGFGRYMEDEFILSEAEESPCWRALKRRVSFPSINGRFPQSRRQSAGLLDLWMGTS